MISTLMAILCIVSNSSEALSVKNVFIGAEKNGLTRTFDLGDRQFYRHAMGTVEIMNDSSLDTLLRVKSKSCACVVERLSTEQLAPGDKSELIFGYSPHTVLQKGEGRFSVAIELLQGSESRIVEFVIKVNLVDSIVVSDKRIDIGDVDGAQKTSHSFFVDTPFGKPDKLVVSLSESKYFTLEPMNNPSPSSFRYGYKIALLPALAPGTYNDFICIQSDDPYSPLIEVPLEAVIRGKNR